MGSDLVSRILTGNEFQTLGAENRILKVTERSFLHLYADALSLCFMSYLGDKADVWGGGSSPAPT